MSEFYIRFERALLASADGDAELSAATEAYVSWASARKDRRKQLEGLGALAPRVLGPEAGLALHSAMDRLGASAADLDPLTWRFAVATLREAGLPASSVYLPKRLFDRWEDREQVREWWASKVSTLQPGAPVGVLNAWAERLYYALADNPASAWPDAPGLGLSLRAIYANQWSSWAEPAATLWDAARCTSLVCLFRRQRRGFLLRAERITNLSVLGILLPGALRGRVRCRQYQQRIVDHTRGVTPGDFFRVQIPSAWRLVGPRQALPHGARIRVPAAASLGAVDEVRELPELFGRRCVLLEPGSSLLLYMNKHPVRAQLEVERELETSEVEDHLAAFADRVRGPRRALEPWWPPTPLDGVDAALFLAREVAAQGGAEAARGYADAAAREAAAVLRRPVEVAFERGIWLRLGC